MKLALDASSAINLLNSDLLALVIGLDEFEIYLSHFVIEELTVIERQRQQFKRLPDSWQLISAEAIDGDTFLDLLASHGLGKGEIECMTLAIQDSSLKVALDDKKARRVAKKILGADRVTGSIGLLRRLSRSRVITSEVAWERYQQMVQNGGFLPALEEDYFN